MTINLHKLVHRVSFKKKAPKAVREIKRKVAKMMKTIDVRIDSKLNQQIWSQGIRHVPKRIRVRVSKKQNS